MKSKYYICLQNVVKCIGDYSIPFAALILSVLTRNPSLQIRFVHLKPYDQLDSHADCKLPKRKDIQNPHLQVTLQSIKFYSIRIFEIRPVLKNLDGHTTQFFNCTLCTQVCNNVCDEIVRD